LIGRLPELKNADPLAILSQADNLEFFIKQVETPVIKPGKTQGLKFNKEEEIRKLMKLLVP
jgi:hypothetical protein